MEKQEQRTSLLTAPSKVGRPWLASCLLQRQVVNVSNLEPVGRVADVVFDPQTARLAGIIIQLQNAPRGMRASITRNLGRRADIGVIALEHIVALNGDVVMVDTDPTLGSGAQLFEGAFRLTEVCELVILTTYGKSLGSLADLLLDHPGSGVSGYVVKPTELAQSVLPRLDDLVDAETVVELNEHGFAAEDDEDAPRLAGANYRVIPAGSRIRFGDSLILLFSEVEPLQPKMVIVSPQPALQSDSRRTSR